MQPRHAETVHDDLWVNFNAPTQRHRAGAVQIYGATGNAQT